MKKSFIFILLSLCLLCVLVPTAHAQQVELLDIPDDLDWDSDYYDTTDVKTGQMQSFSCDIPENGAAVLVFFGPDCGNSKNFFYTLNTRSWVNNPYVKISASNVSDGDEEYVRAMVQEYALNVYEYLDLHNPYDNWMAFDYYRMVSDAYSFTMPLVVVLTHSDSGRTVRYVQQAYTDAKWLYDVLCAVSPSFADYEAKKESGQVEFHFHSYGSWKTTLKPTCTQPGEEARTCDCGAALTRTVKELGHSSDNGTLTKEPTQTQKGEVSFVCDLCGEKQCVELPAWKDTASHSGDLDAPKPTKASLHEAWKAIGDAQDYFEEEPVLTAPHTAGQLTEELLESGLCYFNYVRYAANLPDVQLSEEMNEISQHGAVVLATLDYGLDHYPLRPDRMDDAFYEIGYEATSTSNLSMRMGYTGNPLRYGVQSFMDDHGTNNMLSLGHRQWMLNPVLRNVGFGYAKSQSDKDYILTKVMDETGALVDYDFISWPASGNFPVNLFSSDVAWSISLNPRKYQLPQVEDLEITLTRKADGRTWMFNAGTGAPTYPDTYHLTVDHTGYGVGNCIIFSPGSANIGTYYGKYLITVNGIYSLDGTPASVCYEVDFFDAENECLEHQFTTKVVEPLCQSEGYTATECELCGMVYKTDFTAPLGHDFTGEEVPPTCEEKGYTLLTCSRCGSQREENFVQALGHTYVNGVCFCGASESDPDEPNDREDVLIISGYQTISNETIHGDVYITSTGRAVFDNVTVYGTIYCHGQLTANAVQADFVYAYAFGSMLTCDAFDGTHGYIEGSLYCIDLIIADNALDYAFATWGGGPDGPVEPNEPTEPEENDPTDPTCSHRWSKWITTAPTSKKTGLRTRRCALCGEVEEETLPKLSGKFKDVKDTQYYALPVDWAVQKNITTGMGDGKFAPDANCTRGQIVTFLWRAAGEPEPVSTRNPFKDVRKDDYFYKAVLWAVEEGITKGLSADSFGPNEVCTRAQVCTFLWRDQGEPYAASGNPFQDVKKGEYYYNAVLWAVDNGVTNGMSEGTFAPNATCTRGQIVTFLYRAIA